MKKPNRHVGYRQRRRAHKERKQAMAAKHPLPAYLSFRNFSLRDGPMRHLTGRAAVAALFRGRE